MVKFIRIVFVIAAFFQALAYAVFAVLLSRYRELILYDDLIQYKNVIAIFSSFLLEIFLITEGLGYNWSKRIVTLARQYWSISTLLVCAGIIIAGAVILIYDFIRLHSYSINFIGKELDITLQLGVIFLSLGFITYYIIKLCKMRI